MTVPAQQPPERNPAGFTSDPPYGPWANLGCGNPFNYHLFSDDFDNSLGATGLWTVSESAGGSAVHTAGDGGIVTLTTPATSSDYVSIQLPAADFTLPQGTLAGKQMGFLARLQLSDITNSAFVAGLCDTTATIFTTITDGVWFAKASGSTQITLKVASGGTTVSFNVALGNMTLANSTNFDIAWYIDRFGNIWYSIGSQLVGWIPQSGTGSTVVNYVPTLPVMCPTGKLYSGNQPFTTASGYTLSAANLNPTLGVQAGAAAAKALVADFIAVAKER